MGSLARFDERQPIRLDVQAPLDPLIQQAQACRDEMRYRTERRYRDLGILELTDLIEAYGLENVETWLAELKTSGAVQPSGDPRR